MCAARRLPSLPFGLARGATQKKAPFFSPNAENVGLPVADMAVLRQCRRQGSWSGLERAWQGFFVDCSHQVAFQRKDAQPHDAWHVGLHHYRGSG